MGAILIAKNSNSIQFTIHIAKQFQSDDYLLYSFNANNTLLPFIIEYE